MFGNLRHIVAILIVVAIGAGVFYVAKNENFFRGHQQRASLIEQQTVQLENEIIVPLQRLSAVKIDTEFFTTTEYKALSDMSVSLNEPALIRSNPFAPTGE